MENKAWIDLYDQAIVLELYIKGLKERNVVSEDLTQIIKAAEALRAHIREEGYASR